MQSVEEFFHNYFKERTATLRSAKAVWDPHIKSFFAPPYSPWDHDASVRDSEQENIISVQESADEFEVITSGSVGGRWRMRYRTIRDNESWRIASIEWECGICHGSGKRKDGTAPCRLCKGAGWKLIGQSQDKTQK